MSIFILPLNNTDIKDIEIGINHLNSKYFEKKVWPFDVQDTMVNQSAFTMGEMPVKHLKVMVEKMAIDNDLDNFKSWKDIEKNKKANLIIYVAKFKKNIFSNRYFSNIVINFKKKEQNLNVLFASTAGKRIIDLYYNINEFIEFKDNIKITHDAEEAIKLYT